MKKFLVLLFTLVLTFALVGCGGKGEVNPPKDEIDYEKVNDLIAEIDYLYVKRDELDFSKMEVVERINKAKTDYESLKVEEQALVDNYDNLNEVFKVYESYLASEQDKLKEKEAINEAIAYINEMVPDKATDKTEMKFEPNYIAKDGTKVFLGWTTSDPKTINKQGIVIQPRGRESINVTVKCVVRIGNTKETVEKVVEVKPLNYRYIPSTPVFAYFYSNQGPLTELERKTIDIINLSFGDITENGGISLNSLNTAEVLAERKNHKRVLFSVQDKQGFITWTETSEKREILANSFVKAVEEYHFDGVDIDWEYPSGRSQVDGYVSFVKLLSEKLKKANPEYLLTSAVYGGNKGDSYRIDVSQKYLDYVLLMTYDLNSLDTTSHVSGLGDKTNKVYSVKGTVESYAAKHVPKEKLVIGAAFYGKIFNLPIDSNGFMNVKIKPGEKAVSINYRDIKDRYLSQIGKDSPMKVVRKWDSAMSAAYLEVTEYNASKQIVGKKFITYDDPESIMAKVRYLKREKLGGIMFWELGGDSNDNDLVGAINKAMA